MSYYNGYPERPPVMPAEERIPKTCVECGQGFITNSRVQKRCPLCQPARRAVLQQRCSARLRAKRKAAKAAVRA